MERSRSLHIPVLAEETLHWLHPRQGDTLVDGTMGGGGHTRLLAERVGPQGRIIALDRDPAAILHAESNLSEPPVRCIQSDFRHVRAVLESEDIESVDGILLDLGLSSDQLADSTRGFSFAAEGELDLRFNPAEGEPAWKLLETMPERKLADLIFTFGEERRSRRIARTIVAARRQQRLRTAEQLAKIVQRCVPRAKNHRIHPATRTFQALRIAVNDELGALKQLLADAPSCIRPGG